jgi:hypothetical protein
VIHELLLLFFCRIVNSGLIGYHLSTDPTFDSCSKLSDMTRHIKRLDAHHPILITSSLHCYSNHPLPHVDALVLGMDIQDSTQDSNPLICYNSDKLLETIIHTWGERRPVLLEIPPDMNALREGIASMLAGNPLAVQDQQNSWQYIVEFYFGLIYSF